MELKRQATTRIPMSTPVLRMEVPLIPGYHQHWMKGTTVRLQRALDAGYEFVNASETKVPSVSLGASSAQSGNTDMGSRVSILAGKETGEDGQPLRLYLMKIKQEWYNKDQVALEAGSEDIAASICGGGIGSEKEVDGGNRYLGKRTVIPDMFRKKRKS